MIFIGIDVGANGGMGWIRTTNELEVLEYAAVKFSGETERGAWLAISHFASTEYGSETVVALIEQQGVRPHTDRPKNIATIHHHFGLLRGFLIASGIRFERVQPKDWQKHFKLVFPRTMGHTAKKNRHKAKAEQLFPDIRITHANADAMLIAEYLRHTYLSGAPCV